MEHSTAARVSRGARLVLQVACLCICAFAARGATVSDAYVQQVNSLVATHRASVARLTAPATATAQALLAGGQYYLSGNDAAFFYEASGRSGGLMAIQQYLGPGSMRAGDVLWISYSAKNYQAALTAAAGVQQIGATAIVFGPQPPAGPPPFSNWVDSLTPWTSDDDYTLTGNVLSMWSTTGELAAATARQGKTLVFWQSVSVPGSQARNADYTGILFHTGVPHMQAVSAGTLSAAYLDYVASMLGRIASSELPGILATGQAMAQRTAAGNPVTLMTLSHIVPFVPSLGSNPYVQYLADNTLLGSALARSRFLLSIGYAGVELDPWRTVRLTSGANAAWIVSRLPTQADFTFYGDTVVNQQWDFGDCTVQVPGYDVCILPASGISQLFIYDLLLRIASGGTPAGTTTLTALSGTGQSAPVSSPFTQSLQAKLTDSNGNAIANATVLFTAPASGTSGTFAGSLTASAITNTSGIAIAPTFTANGLAGGPYNVTATSSGVVTSALFALTNNPGPAASIAVTAGTPQNTAINTTFPVALQVSVKDASNNPVPNATVTFTSPAGGPSCTFAGNAATVAAQTNSFGSATASACSANSSAGAYSVLATVPGVAGSAVFLLTNNPVSNLNGPALTVISGNGQNASAYQNFPAPLTVKLIDANGNPMAQVLVTFRAPTFGAGGFFTGGLGTLFVSTDINGLASAGYFAANPVLGPYVVTADSNGLQALFHLTNGSTGAAALTAVSGTPQSTAAGSPFSQTLQAKLTDGGGNAVANASVVFTAPASGASGTFPGGFTSAAVLTDGQGLATSPTFVANGVAGGFTVSGSSNGLTTSFNLTNTAVLSNPTLTAFAGTPQSTTVNTLFPQLLQAKLTDANGNAIANTPVLFSAPSTGVTGRFPGGATSATGLTDGFGIAKAAAFTAGGGAGSYIVIASSGAATASFGLTNTAVPTGGAALVVVSGNAQDATSYRNFPLPLTVKLTDANGNPVAQAAVTFRAPAFGASGFLTGGLGTLIVNTDGNGLASAGFFTANTVAGSYVVTADANGLEAVFHLTNDPN